MPLPADRSSPPATNHNGKGFSLAALLDSFCGYLRNIQQRPIHIQIGIGAGVGVVTGYIFSKTSRFFAMAIGCSIIFLQFLNYRGYFQFNRSQLRRDLDDIQNTLRSELGLQKPVLPNSKEIDSFLIKNGYLLSGYVGGSLIGYGLS